MQRIILSLLFLFSATALFAEGGPRSRLLQVRGSGEVSLESVYADIRLGVEVRGKTAGEAFNEAAKRSDTLVRFLKMKKVSDLRTVGISLQPVMESPKLSSGAGDEIKEYRASNIVAFRVKTQEAGAILDGSISEGASRIDGLSFYPEPSEVVKARREALKLAVADAKDQASAVLGALNLKIIEVVEMRIEGMQDFPEPAIRLQSVKIHTPVVGSSSKITAQVVMQIRY